MSFLNHPSQMTPDPDVGASKPSIWDRMLDALAHDRHQNAERVYVDLIERNGGRLTDEIERKIALHI